MSGPVKTAVLGCGKVGHFHVQAFRRCEGAELTACLDRHREKADAFAAQYGIRGYTDLETMVRETGVQAVSICTPHPNHAALAVEACRLGLHIAVEKPLAASLEDCDAILQAARAAGVTGTTICQRLMTGLVSQLVAVIPFTALMWPVLLVFVIVGVLIGCFGGLIAIRNYLKV